MAQASDVVTAGDRIKQGHSVHGEAFDTGPRTKPWVIDGIGHTHFPITTKSPEAQKWFDQGHTLLHSFWDTEAERAFRWCLKLDPENAMCYWGLSRATAADGPRSDEFLREAVKRRSTVSERERLYIEALEARSGPRALRDRNAEGDARDAEYRKKLETICLRYPDDMEARALLAYAGMGNNRYGTEQIVREILAKQPDHPGAHHYRIHNWNGHEPEQALVSCPRYGAIAPGVPHAQHMPGHIYATVGMWNEAAISLESATRVEIAYMRDRLAFPFNHWNYGHNRNYLSYTQEQLGMAEAAIFGARQLIDAPLDPKLNSDKRYSSHSQGLASLLRTLVKFERWDTLLDARTFPWRDTFGDKMNKAYAESRAWLGKGDLPKAEKALDAHVALGKDLEKTPGSNEWKATYDIQQRELKARVTLARGETLEGLTLLGEAAERQFEMQKDDSDPPKYPELLHVALGRAYLEAESPALAARAFERALTLTRNDLFALAGLVEAYASLGQKAAAEATMARLLYVAADADAGLRPLVRALATGIKATARDDSPRPQRRYKDVGLAKLGPVVWEPFAAPKLEARDSEGTTVNLNEYLGKNVVLVFYLGKECSHCVKQLKDVAGKAGAWKRLDAEVLAVSGNAPEANAGVRELFPAVRLLSDQDFGNARRFGSYDDFEDTELHSTVLIDKRGRVHWAYTGGAPFGDMAFLEKQLERMNAAAGAVGARPTEVVPVKPDVSGSSSAP
jgi:peroxiredoxin